MGDVIEVSPSGRAKCKGCSQAIPKGEVRFGETYESAFSGGEALRYWHLVCAAGKIPGKLRAQLATTDVAIPNRAEVDAALSGKGPKPKAGGGAKAELPFADLAPTGRAKCIVCDEVLPKGELRVAVEREAETPMGPRMTAGYLHPACAASWADDNGQDAEDLLATVLSNSTLDDAQRDALSAAFEG